MGYVEWIIFPRRPYCFYQENTAYVDGVKNQQAYQQFVEYAVQFRVAQYRNCQQIKNDANISNCDLANSFHPERNGVQFFKLGHIQFAVST